MNVVADNRYGTHGFMLRGGYGDNLFQLIIECCVIGELRVLLLLIDLRVLLDVNEEAARVTDAGAQT